MVSLVFSNALEVDCSILLLGILRHPVSGTVSNWQLESNNIYFCSQYSPKAVDRDLLTPDCSHNMHDVVEMSSHGIDDEVISDHISAPTRYYTQMTLCLRLFLQIWLYTMHGRPKGPKCKTIDNLDNLDYGRV
jgi:hypothetical protein